jgi:hypothetical protein
MALSPTLVDREQAKFLDVSGNTAVRVYDLSGGGGSVGINTSYIGGTVTATTSEIEAKVGVAPLTGRQLLYIENRSGANIFYGPTGVTSSTGAKLANNQAVFLSIGPSLSVFVIRASGSGTVVVQEFS